MVKVNPLQARRFAQTRGVLAKTDQIDAQMLAISKRHVKTRLNLLKRQLEEVDANIQELLSEDSSTPLSRHHAPACHSSNAGIYLQVKYIYQNWLYLYQFQRHYSIRCATSTFFASGYLHS